MKLITTNKKLKELMKNKKPLESRYQELIDNIKGDNTFLRDLLPVTLFEIRIWRFSLTVTKEPK